MSAINTSERLFDLVRFMRSELHQADLITDEEYAWLSGGAAMANSPKGGSPSVQRLEEYDDLRAANERLKSELAEAKAALAQINGALGIAEAIKP
jgi:hypothetical protein